MTLTGRGAILITSPAEIPAFHHCAGAGGTDSITAIGVTAGSHNYNLQPVLANYNQGSVNTDAHLATADTVAKGQGINLTALCSSLQPAEPALCADHDGVARPSAGAWDIGAYQYVVGRDTTPPAMPKGLAVY